MGCSHTIIPASEGHLFACPGSRIGSRVRWIRAYAAADPAGVLHQPRPTHRRRSRSLPRPAQRSHALLAASQPSSAERCRAAMFSSTRLRRSARRARSFTDSVDPPQGPGSPRVRRSRRHRRPCTNWQRQYRRRHNRQRCAATWLRPTRAPAGWCGGGASRCRKRRAPLARRDAVVEQQRADRVRRPDR